MAAAVVSKSARLTSRTIGSFVTGAPVRTPEKHSTTERITRREYWLNHYQQRTDTLIYTK